ncbi:Branchpoint-bridging protein [Meyerozyma sp. JA9]|nr:Branchpoint-bridging protein [Meyerozyma sp. JA9]
MEFPATSRPTKWSGTPSRHKIIDGQNLDTIISGHLTSEQLDAYQRYFRIEEISDLLRTSNKRRVGVLSLLPSGRPQENPNLKRDPSPPPKYDNYGNRVNTRDSLMGLSLENERHYLVEKAASTIKYYMSPLDYHKPAKIYEKLYIPLKDFPDINFVGLLLGPRGNTLRQIQEDSGAKLAIRGKGSVKDGKSSGNVITESEESGALMSPKSFANPYVDNNSEDLHVVITADSSRKIEKAIMFANDIINKAISSPMGQNDLKRGQLRELAILNGTLRESRPFIPEEERQAPPVMDISSIVCKVCGKVGHFARDCKLKNRYESTPERSYSPPEARYAPEEEASSAPYSYEPRHKGNGRRRDDDASLPPWKRQKTSVPSLPVPPWQSEQAYSSKPPTPTAMARSTQPTQTQTPVHNAKPKPPPGLHMGERPPPANTPKPPPPASTSKPPPPTTTSKPAPPPVPKPPPPSAAAKPPPPASKPAPPAKPAPPPSTK